MITPENAIEALNAKINMLRSVYTVDEFNNWKKAACSSVANIYPSGLGVVSTMNSIKAYKAVMSGSGNRVNEAKREAEEYLQSLISDLQHFGIPKKSEPFSSKDAINVSINQSNMQHQTTTVSINIEFILDILKGELRTSEIEELKEILESDQAPKEKKKSFIEKIKSFGSDVASNILANLLTNPKVYEQLGGML